MRPVKRLVGSAQSMNRVPEHQPSERLLTIPSGMTASRPALAGIAANKLIRGERYATPWFAAAAATDMEGSVGRLVDKIVPELGIGTSVKGAELDPIADTIAILEVAGAALIGPHVSLAGKAAVLGVLGQESTKSIWALRSAREYKAATISEEFLKGKILSFDVEAIGKEAMTEKLIALGLAVATNDVDRGPVRTVLGVGALAFAGLGMSHGEQARSVYVETLAEMMANLPPQNS